MFISFQQQQKCTHRAVSSHKIIRKYSVVKWNFSSTFICSPITTVVVVFIILCISEIYFQNQLRVCFLHSFDEEDYETP